jgi:hypothetical protein
MKKVLVFQMILACSLVVMACGGTVSATAEKSDERGFRNLFGEGD